MKAIIPMLEKKSGKPIYFQLYNHIREEILNGEMLANEKLPSIRTLAENLEISTTTINLAYSQLNVEGYIYSKPQSGYYVSNIYRDEEQQNMIKEKKICLKHEKIEECINREDKSRIMKYDLECFDFNKWKKCITKVLNEYPELLMFEAQIQGEFALRKEITKYIYSYRGVECTPEQIVVAAGTQQITSFLTMILKQIGINHATLEEPGYAPVRKIFSDRGFDISYAEVKSSGIDIDKLPQNLKTAVYVSPSNQFPTGAVMSIAERHRIIEWSIRNDSIVIEDDYDGELRYFGKPIPALKSMENSENVVYLGSFSSTLFPAVKISYMVLPEKLVGIFKNVSLNYSQTCSKTEQLALAFFMESGMYQTNIKKLRKIYSQKLSLVLIAIKKYGKNVVEAINSNSGINIILNVKIPIKQDKLCEIAENLGLWIVPLPIIIEDNSDSTNKVVFYYNGIPINDIDEKLKDVICRWKES